jgi:tetratricopeptide (TPR) repeat protein
MFLPPDARLRLLGPLLGDPQRAVRIEAARSLAALLRSEIEPELRSSLIHGLAEYRDAQIFNADRPEAHVNLGSLALELGQPVVAQAAYERALQVGPYFIPAYVNLADLYRTQNKDEEGEKLLRTALTIDPRNAAVHHTLGLLLVRQQRLPEAVEELRQAATLDPDTPRYAYVYAMALNATGRTDAALDVLRATHREHSGDRETLLALATMSRDQGQLDEAYNYAGKLSALVPEDPNVKQLLAELKAARATRSP